MQKNSKIKTFFSRMLIITGLILIVVTVILEAYHYPWRTFFDINQSETSLPDPSPIILKGEDKDSVIIEGDGAASNEDDEETKVLPGEEMADSSYLSNYVILGILKIPKLSISQYVLEGTQRQLRYGVGHVVNSDNIGMSGNCVIAGHRSTFFRYLNKLAPGDSVIFKVDGVVYTYTVYKTFTVLPDETWVLSDIKGENYALTLITCTPYVSYNHRMIVRARLININGMSPKKYYERLNKK